MWETTIHLYFCIIVWTYNFYYQNLKALASPVVWIIRSAIHPLSSSSSAMRFCKVWIIFCASLRSWGARLQLLISKYVLTAGFRDCVMKFFYYTINCRTGNLHSVNLAEDFGYMSLSDLWWLPKSLYIPIFCLSFFQSR